MQMEGAWAAQVGTENGYQYNGKELNEDFGLGLYDYGARWYDPAIGRWNHIDPLSEKYFSQTGYQYVSNNPVLMIDPFGLFGESSNDIYKQRQEKQRQRKAENDQDYLDRNSTEVTIFQAEKNAPELFPFTSDLIKEHTERNFPNEDLYNAAGNIFENTFHDYMEQYGLESYEKNSLPFFSPYLNGNVVPDGIANITEISKEGVKSLFQLDWYEATISVKNGSIGMASDNRQISGEISALAFNNIGRKGKTFSLITLHDVRASKPLRSFAKGNNVNFQHFVSYYSVSPQGHYQITFLPRLYIAGNLYIDLPYGRYPVELSNNTTRSRSGKR